MPYVNIKVTDEGVTIEQKKQLISGTSQLLQKVLIRIPARPTLLLTKSMPTTGAWAMKA